MSIEKIIAEAIDNNPLKLKEAFEGELNARIRTALEEKYKEMTTEEEVVSEETDLVEEDEDDSDDDGEEEFDEKACVAELKKRHADGESKADCVNAVKEKYGCSAKVANELYASNCGG